MRRVVIQHRRGDTFARRESRRHAVRSDDRNRRAVRDELLDRDARVVRVGPSIGPVVDDVVVVRDLDVVEIDRAELRHLRDEKIGEALPARAAGVRGAALALEHVPIRRLIGRDHELRIDFRERQRRPGRGRRGGATLSRQRASAEHRAGGDTCRGFEKGPPRGAGWSFPRIFHTKAPRRILGGARRTSQRLSI